MTLLSAAATLTLVLYALSAIVTLLRLFRGPRAQDRVVALDFIFMLAMLVLLVLAIRYDSSMYFEPALLMALCGFVSSLAAAKFLLRGEVIE